MQEMKEKRELLIQEREKKLAADLTLDNKRYKISVYIINNQ